MKKLDELLQARGQEMEQLKVPDELEERLRKALEKHRRPARGRKWGVNVKKAVFAASLLLCLLVGYNFKSLAFYGKQLFGYDEIMSDTLKSLNELGKGQPVGKSHVFGNGASLLLDGVMVDDNQLVLFYTLRDPSGDAENIDLNPGMHIKGLVSRYLFRSSYGIINDDKTEVHYVASFDAPHFYEKDLALHFALQMKEGYEAGEVPFQLDRNKAMGHTLKKNLNETIRAGRTDIRFESILASPTKTVVKGSVQKTLELVWDQLRGERLRPVDIGFELYVDGKPLSRQGGSMSTDMKGIRFSAGFDPLPPGLKRLQLQVTGFTADYDVEGEFALRQDMAEQTVKIGKQDITIHSVTESRGDTYVTLSTEESVVLTRVYLATDVGRRKLQETVSDRYTKTGDGTVIHTRTLHFKGAGRELKLRVERMTYREAFDRVIEIPVQ